MKKDNLLDKNGHGFVAAIMGRLTSGIISVENGIVYLCQNEINGAICLKKFGYKYSWAIGIGSKSCIRSNDVLDLTISDFSSSPKENEQVDLKEEDEVVIKGSKKKYKIFIIGNKDKIWLKRGKDFGIGPFKESELELKASANKSSKNYKKDKILSIL